MPNAPATTTRLHLGGLVLVCAAVSSCGGDGSGMTPLVPANDPRPVDVRDACNTFVSQSSPRGQTPLLRQGKAGKELVVAFTPAGDSEADAIIAAVNRGPVTLILHPSLERVTALGVEDGGYLVLSVASAAQASEVQRLLCF